MKNFSKAAIVILFLAIGCWALTLKTTNYQRTTAFDKESQKKMARDLYLQNCARCHGADGRSENELGKKLEAADLTSRSVQRMSGNKISNVIIFGEGEMPAFGKRLSKTEIKSLARYVRSFRKTNFQLITKCNL